MQKYLTVVLLSIALSACDQGRDEMATVEVPAEKTGSPAEEAVSRSVPASEADSTGEATEKKRKKLDLSLPENLSLDSNSETDQKENALLPDMFAKKESRTSVGGGVHRDEENPDLMRSVNGGEVTVEFKTD